MSNPKPIAVIHTGKETTGVYVCSHIIIRYVEIYNGSLHGGSYDEFSIWCDVCAINYDITYYIGD
jgi:hypothetical protein